MTSGVSILYEFNLCISIDHSLSVALLNLQRSISSIQGALIHSHYLQFDKPNDLGVLSLSYSRPFFLKLIVQRSSSLEKLIRALNFVFQVLVPLIRRSPLSEGRRNEEERREETARQDPQRSLMRVNGT